MKTIQRHLVLAALTFSGVAGCEATAMNTASEAEPVDDVSQELQETACTTAASVVKKTVTGTAPTSCGSFQDFSAISSTSYNTNPATCPFQFVVEVGRATNTPLGSGYYFQGAPYTGGIVTGFSGQASCESQHTSYAAWSFVAGAWSLVGEVWLKGSWHNDPDTLFPCTWATYNSPSGSLDSVPSNATKLRIAAAQWTEAGTKGADGSDSYRPVLAGIAAGQPCPPGLRGADDTTF